MNTNATLKKPTTEMNRLNEAERGTSTIQTQTLIPDGSVTSTTKLHAALNKEYFFKYYSKRFSEDSAHIMAEIAYSHALFLSESDLNLLVMKAHESALIGNTTTKNLVIDGSVKFWKRIRTMLGACRNISIAITCCVAGLYIWLPSYSAIIRNVLESSGALSVALWEGCKYSEKRVNTQMAQSNLMAILVNDFEEKSLRSGGMLPSSEIFSDALLSPVINVLSSKKTTSLISKTNDTILSESSGTYSDY
jgi:hypothetical protein